MVDLGRMSVLRNPDKKEEGDMKLAVRLAIILPYPESGVITLSLKEERMLIPLS